MGDPRPGPHTTFLWCAGLRTSARRACSREQAPRDCPFGLARRCTASARQTKGDRLVISVSSVPGQRMSRTTSYNVLSLHAPRACTCHDAQARDEGQAWAGRSPLASKSSPCTMPVARACLGWLCGSPAHMWWLLAAGHHDSTSSLSQFRHRPPRRALTCTCSVTDRVGLAESSVLCFQFSKVHVFKPLWFADASQQS